jgi:hypothetical protein
MSAANASVMRNRARWAPRVLAGFLVLTLAACGGGGSDKQAAPPAPAALLSGDDASLATGALVEANDAPVLDDEVSKGYLLSRLRVLLRPDATVGQVKAAALAIGALAITSSEPGSPLLLIRVPRQESVAALRTLAATLRAQPGIAFAWPGRMAKVSVLPENSPGSPVQTSELSHLMANRFPQAWNARNAAPADCLNRIVTVYVLDVWGDPSYRPNFFDQADRGSFVTDPGNSGRGQFGAPEVMAHGYDVVLTLIGKFDLQMPTGANGFADCVEIHQINANSLDYAQALKNAAQAIAADPNPRVILSMSVNFPNDDICGPANNADACDAITILNTPVDKLRDEIVARVALAGKWAALSAAAHLDQKALITQAAGNVDPDPAGFLSANYAGFGSVPFSAPPILATHLAALASLLTDPALWRSADPGLPDLTFDGAFALGLVQGAPLLGPANAIPAANLLVVDSGTPGAVPTDVGPSDFNFTGADVRAVGEGVVLPTGDRDGTSFSTPMVAGLAAFLWNLAPALQSLPPSATVEHIRKSAQLTANSPDVPVVDAYAAVLRLDNVPGCCVGQLFAPIRLGLVDVDGDGRFTGADLQKFSDAYGLTDPNTPTIPAARDYSRFDLNGDGFTGGILTAAFDVDANGLDANGQPTINTAQQTVEGYDVRMNEAALSDLQILCFYAYSLLYDGSGQNAQIRDHLLGAERCAGVTMVLAFPPTVPDGSSAQLAITLQQATGQGQSVPAAGVPYQLQVTNGVASPASGVTDANGNASTSITPVAGASTVSVAAVASVCPGCAVLAHGNASAQVTSLPAPGGHYVGTFTQPCSGFFGGSSTTTGPAVLDLRISNSPSGSGVAVVVAADDPFFKFGVNFTLSGPASNFEGFHDAGSFTWTVTGVASPSAAHLDVDMVGTGCRFAFEGSLVP